MAITISEGPADAVAVVTGEYTLDRVLGEDRLGPVLLARNARGRRVTVRMLSDELAADPVVRARFFRAAELGFRLSHPNVVRVIDTGDEGRPSVVLEYVEGETLAQRLADGGRCLSGSEIVTLATHLAAGLAHAHASGVVHGAVDPGCVVLGEDGVARLTDFGFARIISGISRIDPAVDVHALGEILRRLGGDGLPAGLAMIIDAAVAPDAAARPSAVDLHHRLLTLTGPPDVWLAPAVASAWTAG